MILKSLIVLINLVFLGLVTKFGRKLYLGLKSKEPKILRYKILSAVFASLLVISVTSGIWLGKKTIVTHNKIDVTKIEEFHDRYVIFLADGNVVLKEELKWRNTDHIYYEVAANYYGESTVTLVVRK
jgi:hypothetical protein